MGILSWEYNSMLMFLKKKIRFQLNAKFVEKIRGKVLNVLCKITQGLLLSLCLLKNTKV